MKLEELQNGFRSWLTTASDDAAATLGGAHQPGLAVYQNNYRAQLVNSLGATYPQVRSWMGEDNFMHAAVKHIDNHPPHSWTLDAYADEFGETLRDIFPRNPDLHELAWIEHALSTAFVAGDAQPVPAADLASVDWESAQLRFTPTLQTAPATTNASDIWWAMQEGEQHPEGSMLEEPKGHVAWRRGYVSCLRTVSQIELDAIAQVQANGSFSGLCDFLVEQLGESEGVATAGGLLADWVGSELITGIE
ncbi:HvfC/BufC family peptide modification chaperone [Pseudoduganella sp. RAF53_2]|uniref:HvfC/BufC family peptide modification chaperone n=1 Tax=unclassified Pseudoduganella TaxID=2637179 RepID=UPI003F99C417